MIWGVNTNAFKPVGQYLICASMLHRYYSSLHLWPWGSHNHMKEKRCAALTAATLKNTDYKRGQLIWIYHRCSPEMTVSNISTSVCQCNGSSLAERNAHETSIIFWVYFKALCKKRPVTFAREQWCLQTQNFVVDIFIFLFLFFAVRHVVHVSPLSPTACVSGDYSHQKIWENI